MASVVKLPEAKLVDNKEVEDEDEDQVEDGVDASDGAKKKKKKRNKKKKAGKFPIESSSNLRRDIKQDCWLCLDQRTC